jgi:hypothetical protein
MTRRIGWLIARTFGLAVLALTATHRPGAVSAECKACNSYCYIDTNGNWICTKSKCGSATTNGNVECTDKEGGGCIPSGGTCKVS